MKLVVPFKQSKVIDAYLKAGHTLPTKGMCFRVAFKWAACKAVGAAFKYDQLNPAKTVAKHVAYRQGSLAKEKDPSFDFGKSTNFKQYVSDDQVAAATALSEWAKKFKDANKQEHSVKVGAAHAGDLQSYLANNPIAGVKALVYGFYGRGVNPNPVAIGPRGHAVALSGGASPRFFDPNSGEWDFDANEDVGAAVTQHIKLEYTEWKREALFVMPLG